MTVSQPSTSLNAQPAASAEPRYVWYGDDFTGATDTLATVARAGLRTVLFLGVPTPAQLAAAGPLHAIGIAGAARSMDAAQMAQELAPVARFMAQSGARVLHYKCCSTFDSAPHVGSLGQALRVLSHERYHPMRAIVGGQPNLGRYCVFGNLFARAGHDAAVYRLDRHPTMSVHPVTPMGEADLRLYLQRQGLADIRLLSFNMHAEPLHPEERAKQDAAWDQWLETEYKNANEQPDAVLMDVSAESQLAAIGRLLWRQAARAPVLALGPSSVAQSLIAGWRSTGEWRSNAETTFQTLAPAKGPVFTFVGSLSPVSAQQLAASRCYEHYEVDIEQLLSKPGYGDQCVQTWVGALLQGRSVMPHTSPPRCALTADLTAGVARASAQLLAAVVREMALRGQTLRRVGIVGGDTSSHATQALGLWGLVYHSSLAPGVTMSVARSDDSQIDGLELMLKGGQMGDEGLLDRLVTGGMLSA